MSTGSADTDEDLYQLLEEEEEMLNEINDQGELKGQVLGELGLRHPIVRYVCLIRTEQWEGPR